MGFDLNLIEKLAKESKNSPPQCEYCGKPIEEDDGFCNETCATLYEERENAIYEECVNSLKE